jgi:hypothetical protein
VAQPRGVLVQHPPATGARPGRLPRAPMRWSARSESTWPRRTRRRSRSSGPRPPTRSSPPSSASASAPRVQTARGAPTASSFLATVTRSTGLISHRKA